MAWQNETKKHSLQGAVAGNVRRLRLDQGLSQERVAARAGITRETVRAVEAGETDIRLSTLEQLAIGLGVDIQELIEDTRVKRCAFRSGFELLDGATYIQSPLVSIASLGTSINAQAP